MERDGNESRTEEEGDLSKGAVRGQGEAAPVPPPPAGTPPDPPPQRTEVEE